MGGSEAGTLAKLAGVDQLVLTHLPLHGDIQEILAAASSTFNGSVELAEVGKSYTI